MGIKIETWPMWLQIVVMVPHALLAGALLWLWWPRESAKQRRWFLALSAYFLLFYWIFVR